MSRKSWGLAVGALLAALAILFFAQSGSRKSERGGSTAASVQSTASTTAKRAVSAPRVPKAAVPRALTDAPGHYDKGEATDRPPRVGERSSTQEWKQEWKLSDTRAGRAVAAHLNSYEFAGPTAQARFDASLAKMRETALESARELEGLYAGAQTGDYHSRYLAAGSLRQLESHEAADALSQIAADPIPENMSREHGALAIQEEGMIRIAAIDGLGHLALRGNAQALASLEQLMAGGDPLVRRYAAQEYVEAKGHTREARAYAASVLPESDRAAVDAVTLKPEDVPVLEAEPPAPNPKKTPREKSDQSGDE